MRQGLLWEESLPIWKIKYYGKLNLGEGSEGQDNIERTIFVAADCAEEAIMAIRTVHEEDGPIISIKDMGMLIAQKMDKE